MLAIRATKSSENLERVIEIISANFKSGLSVTVKKNLQEILEKWNFIRITLPF